MNFFRKTDKVANSTDSGNNVPNKVGVTNESNSNKNDTCNNTAMKLTKKEDSDGGDVDVERKSDGINSNTAVVVQDGSIAKVVDNSKVDVPSDDINDVKKAVDTKPNNNGADGAPLLNDSSNNNNMSPPMKGDEGSDDEYTDSDSEYTYETISDDDEAHLPKQSSKGWFGFLRGGNKNKRDDEEYSSGSEEEEKEEEEEDIVAAIDNLHSVLKEGEEEILSSDDEHIKHPLLNDSPSPSTNNININSTKESEEEEEAILMAQAISRVQQRIQKNNGNLYEALDEHDKKLVDSLKGVKDEDKIREVVEKSMYKVEEKKGGVESVVEDGVSGGGGEKLIVDTNNAENNATAIMMEDTPKVTEIIKSHVVHQTDDQPLLVTEEPVIGSVPDTKPEVHTEPLLNVEPSMQTVENEHRNIESEDEDEDEDDDDEQPTLEEQRSLLSLAAEHDRVDVIQELLNDPTLHELLLAGVSSSSNNNNNNGTSNGEDENTVVSFVPPPLHAAVAHGSINAASCLLRMGADPSIRPNVPLPYLLGSYQNNTPSRSGSSGSVSMEEDRNYKKYHDMSAWELAFGSTTVIIEDDKGSEGVVAKKEREEDTPITRGWFGFGSTKPKEEEEESIIDVVVDGVAKKRRIKRKLPLNIAPSKLEGIKHAFTAEMLRAIGSDEVDRVSQLLDAGMDGSMEVAGKSLTVWAIELDATGCCELFEAGMVEDDKEDEVQQKDEDDDNQSQVDTDNKTTTVTPTLAQQQKVRVVQDERLAGLSLSDIETLTSENLNLIPALTTCRDDLASEAHICQSILRDVGSGKAGLSSQSLLELVRSLKAQRGKAEEAATAWQRAWEEREDEVDFFYEEVLDDVMREELGPVLDAVEPIDPSLQGLSNGVAANMDDAAKRFIEVDNRVNTLRASIARLAEESTHFVSEIEHHGMAGALSLTRSLRDEVKEVEKKMNLAMMGEGLCRRKIEIIQHRLGHHEEGTIPVEEDEKNVVDDNRMEDYQLQAIVQQQEQQRESGASGGNSSPLSLKRPEDDTDEQSPGREERDSLVVAAANQILGENNFMISNALVDTLEADEDEETNGIIVEDIQEEEIESVSAATHEPRKPVDHPSQTPDQSAIHGGSDTVMPAVEAHESPASAAAEADQSKSPATTDNKKVDVKPSSAIAEGKSTAIVVHSPNNQAGSISSQILEILLRIVGLRRETSRSNSYHDVEGNPHVMII